MGGGAPTVQAQQPSQQELDLRAAQAQLAQQQAAITQEQLRQQNLLQPILMGQQGYIPTYGIDPQAQARANALDQQISQIQGFMANTPQYITNPNGGGGSQNAGLAGAGFYGSGADNIGPGNGPPGGYAPQTAGQTLNPAWNAGWSTQLQQLQQQRAGISLDPNQIQGWTLSPEARAHQEKLKELQAQQDQITQMMNERTLKALNGELPVDPALERELQQGRLTLQDTLTKNLGTGYSTSTPGIQALADFDKRAEELRYMSRRDQLQGGAQVGLAEQQFTNNLNQMQFGNTIGLDQLPNATAAALSGASQSFNSAVNPYLQDRQFGLTAGMSNAQAASAASQGEGQLFGSGIGAAATVGAAFFI